MDQKGALVSGGWLLNGVLHSVHSIGLSYLAAHSDELHDGNIDDPGAGTQTELQQVGLKEEVEASFIQLVGLS